MTQLLANKNELRHYNGYINQKRNKIKIMEVVVLIKDLRDYNAENIARLIPQLKAYEIHDLETSRPSGHIGTDELGSTMVAINITTLEQLHNLLKDINHYAEIDIDWGDHLGIRFNLPSDALKEEKEKYRFI